MKKKGLCSTCASDKFCDFPRNFPVTQCEEFNGYTANRGKTKNNKKNYKSEKAAAHTQELKIA